MPRYDTHWQSRTTKRRAVRVRWARLLLVPGIVLGLVMISALVIAAPFLRVRQVVVQDTTYLSDDAVIDAVKAQPVGFVQRVLSLAHVGGWPGSVSREVLALLPGAQSVTIDRQLFSGTVLLTVVERDPVGVWCFASTDTPACQWFDDAGIVYGRAYTSEGSLVPVVYDYSQAKAGEERRVLAAESLDHFLGLMRLLKSRAVSPREMRITRSATHELVMTTYNGPELRFTLRIPPDHVAPVLDDLMRRGIFTGLQYVDFRSPKRAFFQ